MILVYTFPMFIFAITPALMLKDFLAKHYDISEKTQRIVMLIGTFLVAFSLSIFLQYY